MSDILSATTPPVQVPDETDNIQIQSIDTDLSVTDVGSTSAFVSWRFFSFDEKQYIDGVQIR